MGLQVISYRIGPYQVGLDMDSGENYLMHVETGVYLAFGTKLEMARIADSLAREDGIDRDINTLFREV